MSSKMKNTEDISVPESASKYRDNTTQKEKDTVNALRQEYDSKNAEIPPLSQREREHLTYLAVLEEYNIAKRKRTNYRKYGALSIIISGVVFLALIFSLETKIEFLCLWIFTILGCVAVMIRAEYTYHRLKTMLGIADEYDYFELEEEDGEEEEEVKPPAPPQTPVPPAGSDNKEVIKQSGQNEPPQG